MLLTGKTLLDVANKHGFAVPAFNISDWAMGRGIFEISEEMNAPLIIAIHPDELRHTGAELMPAILERAHRSSVPVTVHFDHGTTYDQILWAIKSGFTSVMFDGSMLPFEENIALTKKAAGRRPRRRVVGRGRAGHHRQNRRRGRGRRGHNRLHRPRRRDPLR